MSERGHKEVAADSKAAAKRFVEHLMKLGKVPADAFIAYESVGDQAVERYRTVTLESEVRLTNQDVSGASPVVNQGRWSVSTTLNPAGARVFEQFTGASVGRFLAIVLDDDVTSVPRIQEAIPGGRVQIEMGTESSPRDVSRLARSLSAGTYIPPLVKQSERIIGPASRPR